MILKTGEKITLTWNMNDMACLELDALKQKLKQNFMASPHFFEEAMADILRVQHLIRRGNHE